jgi:hypothetical protein
MRAIKLITALASLIFLGNAVLFYSIATRGYGHTIEALHPAFGSADSLVLALISVVSLVSIPVTALFGVIAIASARRFGRSALIFGLLCCVLSAGSFVLWKRYGGIPGPNAPNGPTPVTRQATPNPPPARRSK